MPNTIENIANKAFFSCKNLIYIKFSTNLSFIGDYSFSKCYNLKDVDLSKTKLTDINDNSFSNCKKLKSIKFPNNLKVLHNRAFTNCNMLKYIDLSNTELEYIGEECFQNCFNLERVILPNTIKYIENEAFESCSNLKYINIPISLKKLSRAVFGGCLKLNLDIPDTIEYIDSYAITESKININYNSQLAKEYNGDYYIHYPKILISTKTI
jgi:hypothetical protein